ncbi:unnamed protein product [Heligmosomoides polygyrus]|uniref:Sec2p domain-containing protein n=1 Tax=Heligmosomoides polygyrus TaxID=6339 RepID=A0A183FK66_HELPZ|nr:unnamed protein product [Heligmosomoides polygyrus]
MRQELEAARRSIAEKDEKMCRLTRIQDTVDAEVQELTEKLFQEAYRMVNYAEERRERSERLLNESRLKKAWLIPGIGPVHRKSPSALWLQLSSARRSSSSGAAHRKSSTMPPTTAYMAREKERENEQKQAEAVEEVDPILMFEFTSWRDAGHPFAHHPFMDRVNSEEITPCMLFNAKELSDAILDSIAANKLELEPVHEDKPCALTNVARFCPYRVRVAEDAPWYRISLLARNRIAAVCDYYTFIRYLRVGLIKSGVRDAYFDVMQLRKNMCLAKLGLGFVPKTNLRPGF